MVRDRLPRPDNEATANLWARGPAQVVRSAGAYAIGTASDTVTTEQIKAAVAVWHYCAESAEAVFSIAAESEGGAGDRRPAEGAGLPAEVRGPGGRLGDADPDQQGGPRGQRAARRGRPRARVLLDKGHVEYREVKTGGRALNEYRLPPR